MTMAGMEVTARTRLIRSRLLVELVDDELLNIRSLMDPRQAYLVSLPAAPAIDGLARATPLSRLCTLTWGIAFGSTSLPPQATVRFAMSSVRYRRSVVAVPQLLGKHAWIADAEGDFNTATLVVDGVETARTALSQH
jgi:hypothetical protein